MEKIIHKTLSGIQYRIEILDLGKYVFWRVNHPDTLTKEIRDKLQKLCGYPKYKAVDFGTDNQHGYWEAQKN